MDFNIKKRKIGQSAIIIKAKDMPEDVQKLINDIDNDLWNKYELHKWKKNEPLDAWFVQQGISENETLMIQFE